MKAPRYICPCGSNIAVSSIIKHLNCKYHKDMMVVKKELFDVKKCNNELKEILKIKVGDT